MAEALLRRRDIHGRSDVHSAGLDPKDQVHPMALRVLNEIGVSTDGLYPKSSGYYLNKVSVRHAIIVCSKAQGSCPKVFPFAANTHYWPFEDPAEFVGDEAQTLAKFREIRDEVDARLKRWVTMELD